jgi:hypothetical protein
MHRVTVRRPHLGRAIQVGCLLSRGAGFDYIVAPSGSCVHHVRSNFDAIEQTEEVKRVAPDLPEEIATAHKLSR